MTSVSNSSSTSALQQMMLMLQQMTQSNTASLANMDTTQEADDTSGVNAAGSASNSNLVSNTPSVSSDMLMVLLQGQGIAPADSGTSSGQPNGLGQDFQQLSQAIQSGNLSAAQQAYTTVSQDISNQSQNGQTPDANSPFLQAFNQIGSDLQSGNLTGAQQTLSSLQQTGGAHHHHHGGGSGGGGGLASLLDGGSDSTSSSASSSSSAQPTTVTETNADGSITTVTTAADGTVSTATTPASTGQTASSGSDALEDVLNALEQIGIG